MAEKEGKIISMISIRQVPDVVWQNFRINAIKRGMTNNQYLKFLVDQDELEMKKAGKI